jgi:hypothetical protein
MCGVAATIAVNGALALTQRCAQQRNNDNLLNLNFSQHNYW